jgi:hypothetical protein
MARSNFRVEQGIEILTPNGTTGVWILQAAGAPLGTSGPTDDANVGSVYLKNDGSGELYRKTASNSLATDWKRFTDESIYTAVGIAFGATDMGTYTGAILTDSTDQTTLNQELSDAIEAIQGGTGGTVAVAAGTPTTIATCTTDVCNGLEWEICVYEDAAQGNKEFFKVSSLHDGETGPYVDAAAFDESVHSKLKLADIAGLSYTTKLNGTGVGVQTIGLEISATAAVTVKFRRTSIP